jgi:hypothetical protein
VCLVRRVVCNQVRNRLPNVFEDLGESEVKNDLRPLRVYRIPAGRPGCPHLAEVSEEARHRSARRRRAACPNFGRDPEMEFFLDSTAEDLITELRRGAPIGSPSWLVIRA